MTTRKTAAAKPATKKAAAKPATEFDPSGAPHQTADVDPSDPALDADPRANTSADQNRIDLNDPSATGAEAVARNLAAQGEG